MTATFYIHQFWAQLYRTAMKLTPSGTLESRRRPAARRYDLRSRWMTGRVVKHNCHTVWVELPTGEIIKRHKRKHTVGLYV